MRTSLAFYTLENVAINALLPHEASRGALLVFSFPILAFFAMFGISFANFSPLVLKIELRQVWK